MSEKKAKQARRDAFDIPQIVADAISRGKADGYKWELDKEGRTIFSTIPGRGGFWIHVKLSPMKCRLYQNIMFQQISKNLPGKDQFVPSPCMECWKVVVRPEKYEDFLSLYDKIIDCDFYSKIGIEMREDVDALYGAYFYCNSKKEGLDRLDYIRELTGETAFLKRGCTEYEAHFGRSDLWEIGPRQQEIEEEIYKRVDLKKQMAIQSHEEKQDILRFWERFANEVGPDYKPSHFYVTYERDRTVVNPPKVLRSTGMTKEELKGRKRGFPLVDLRIRVTPDGKVNINAPPNVALFNDVVDNAKKVMKEAYPDQQPYTTDPLYSRALLSPRKEKSRIIH